MATLPKEQANLFWNMFQNIQADIKKDSGYDYDREVLTYLQADDRYVSYLKDYLADSAFSDQQKTDIMAQGQAAHDQSLNTLNDVKYSFSTTMQGMASDMYDRVEANDPDALGNFAKNPPAPIVAEKKPVTSVSSPFALAAFPKLNPLTMEILLPGETPDPFKFQPLAQETNPARKKSIVEISEPEITHIDPLHPKSIIELGHAPELKPFQFETTPANLGPIVQSPDHIDLPGLGSITSEIKIPVATPIVPEDFKRPQAEIDAIVEGRKREEAEKLQAAKNPTDTGTAPATSAAFNIATSQIADASVLVNGVGKDDMAFLKDVAKQARSLGVDENLVSQIETDANTKSFVTSAAATKGVQVYADRLNAALQGDGKVSNEEYKAALSGLFTEIAGGAVVDHKGRSDDIAAPAGMEAKARNSMHNVLGRNS